MAKKTITLRDGDLITGSALRHASRLLSPGTLAYDTARAAACNEILLCEIAGVPPVRFHVPTHTGIERVRRDAGGLVFSADALREGLVAITAGNRYAPRAVTGGLEDPLTGRSNGEIRGGSVIADLMDMNIAGRVQASATGEERARLHVLGVLLEDDGAPMRLPSRPAGALARPRPGGRRVLVAGSAMESGKTTCCVALAAELRARGVAVAYEKKTGTACMRDPLRVALGRYEVFERPGAEVRACDVTMPIADFVDIAGTVSDVSVPIATFVARSIDGGDRWAAEHAPAVHLIELADNLAHRSNQALLAAARFGGGIRDLIYVPDASFDAAFHAATFLRATYGFRVAFSGPLAADEANTVLRDEVESRLGVPCIAARTRDGTISGGRLADWIAAGGDPMR